MAADIIHSVMNHLACEAKQQLH